jgi:hypothetical protein
MSGSCRARPNVSCGFIRATSAFPSKTTVQRTSRNGSFVPITDIQPAWAPSKSVWHYRLIRRTVCCRLDCDHGARAASPGRA